MKKLILFVLVVLSISTQAFVQTPAHAFSFGGIPIQFQPSDVPMSDITSYMTYDHHKILSSGGCTKYYKTLSIGSFAKADLFAWCASVGKDVKDTTHAFFGISPINICGIRTLVEGDERGKLAYGISGSFIVGGFGSVTGQSKATFCGN